MQGVRTAVQIIKRNIKFDRGFENLVVKIMQNYHPGTCQSSGVVLCLCVIFSLF